MLRPKIRKYLYYFALSLPILFLMLQLVPISGREVGDTKHSLTAQYPISPQVSAVLEKACMDCHSYATTYPWYAEVQPVAWWIDHHVEEGRDALNFSAFTHRRAAVQYHKFEEIVEVMEEQEMPLASYTWTHREAVLTDAERTLLIEWAQGCLDTLRNHYPPDSLVLRRRKS
jgi:hypothetical protein